MLHKFIFLKNILFGLVIFSLDKFLIKCKMKFAHGNFGLFSKHFDGKDRKREMKKCISPKRFNYGNRELRKYSANFSTATRFSYWIK